MHLDEIIEFLDSHAFFKNGLGMPRHISGRYCQFRKSFTLNMSTGDDLVISFHHMELNDNAMLDKYDEMYHLTAVINADTIFHQTTETMTPEEMQQGVRQVLTQLGDPDIDAVLLFG